VANRYSASTLWKKHQEARLFQAEKEIFKEVAGKLGLSQRTGDDYCWARHPLAFVTEAADDICYRIVDLEDAYNQKLIRETDLEEVLSLILPSEDIDRVEREPESQKIEVIRALSIREAIKMAFEAFQNNYDGIVQGTFDSDLIAVTKLSLAFRAIEDLQKKKVYCNDRVLKIEVAGFSVIAGLLDHFVEAANCLAGFGASNSSKALNQKIIDLVPKQFFSDGNAPSRGPYMRLLEITDFISGMTDSYALSLFRSLTGIQLP
jgi:dGTPase